MKNEQYSSSRPVVQVPSQHHVLNDVKVGEVLCSYEKFPLPGDR